MKKDKIMQTASVGNIKNKMKYYRNDKEVSKEEILNELKEKERPAPILLGPNAEAIIEAGKRRQEQTIYTVTDNDTGKTYNVVERSEPEPKQQQPEPEMDTATLLREAKKLLQKPSVVPTATPKQQVKINQVKEFNEILQNPEILTGGQKPPKQVYRFPKTIFDKEE